MKSIIQPSKDRDCYFCGKRAPLHLHHVMEGTANRRKSDKWGLVVYLCPEHHNMSSQSVHYNKEMELKLKRHAQYNFELLYGHDVWMKEFGRNYLDEDK